MTTGVYAVAVRRGAHTGAVNIIESLSDRNPFARVAAVKVAGSADKFQISRRRRIHVIVTPGSVNHFRHRLADGGDENVADPRRGPASRRVLAVKNRPFRHMDLHRPHLTVTPRHVPKKRVGKREREMRHGARQRGIVIRVRLWTRAGEVEVQLVARFGHRAIKLLRHCLSALAVERGHILASHPGSIRHGFELGARFILGILDHFLAGQLHELETEFVDQAEISLGADVVAGDHRFEIEADILRVAALPR